MQNFKEHSLALAVSGGKERVRTQGARDVKVNLGIMADWISCQIEIDVRCEVRGSTPVAVAISALERRLPLPRSLSAGSTRGLRLA